MRLVTTIMCCIILMTGVPLVAQAQGLGDPVGFPAVPAPGAINPASVIIVPSVKFGYTTYAMGLNFPMGPRNILDSRMDISGLDIKFNDAGFWIGKVGLEATVGSRWGAAAIWTVSFDRNLDVVTAESPSVFFERASRWNARKFEWWELDLRGSYNLWNGSGVIAGVKWDHTMAVLNDPRTADGLSLQSLPDVNLYEGDLRTKLFTPYLGVKVSGSYYRGVFLFSPLAFANVQAPLRLVYDASGRRVSRTRLEEGEYTLKRRGLLLEALLEYEYPLTAGLSTGLWLQGNVVKVRGTGEDDLEAYRVINSSGAIDQEAFASATAACTLTRYMMGVGITFNLTF